MKTATAYNAVLVALLLAAAPGRAAEARAADSAVALVIKRLGAEKFADRQAAEKDLVKLAETGPELWLKQCLAGYRQTDDPEVRLRLKAALEQVVRKHVFQAPRGFLGIQINNVFVGEGGRLVVNGTEIPARCVWVGNVIEGSGAAKAGMQPNDLILAINGQPWAGDGPDAFTRSLQAHKPGTVVKLTVLRGETTNELTATLGELPETERERAYSETRWGEFFADWWQRNLGEEPPREP